LVILAKLACFDLLKKLFPLLYIPTEVYREVVVSGAGLPGASEKEFECLACPEPHFWPPAVYYCRLMNEGDLAEQRDTSEGSLQTPPERHG
jgi:hypothetical protein